MTNTCPAVTFSLNAKELGSTPERMYEVSSMATPLTVTGLPGPSHGLVPVSDVVGVGLVKYWPLNHISTLDAHHDVFKDVPEGSAD